MPPIQHGQLQWKQSAAFDAVWRLRARELSTLKYEFAALRFQVAAIKHAIVCRKAGFNPAQPRVPAGRREGGRWVSETGLFSPQERLNSPENTGPAVATSTVYSESAVLSDASPDPIRPGQQYAAVQIEFGPNALTGISRIDDTTKKLTQTLATVVDTLPAGSGPLYGIAVHTAFAAIIRTSRLEGIGVSDVECTFSLVDTFRYGSKDSIRTDVVLRNDTGDIIAIYDVKTGGASLNAGRLRELRAKTGVGANVPIIELNVKRGVLLKGRLSRRCRRFMGVIHVHGN